jgi:hypothetical protein
MVDKGKNFSLKPSDAVAVDINAEGTPKLPELLANWLPADEVDIHGWPVGDHGHGWHRGNDEAHPVDGHYDEETGDGPIECPDHHRPPSEKLIDQKRARLCIRSGPMVFQSALKFITDRNFNQGIALPGMKDIEQILSLDIDQLIANNGPWQCLRQASEDTNNNLSNIDGQEDHDFWEAEIARDSTYSPLADWKGSSKVSMMFWCWDESTHDRLASHCQETKYPLQALLIFGCRSLASLDGLGAFEEGLLREYRRGIRSIGLRANQMLYIAQETKKLMSIPKEEKSEKTADNRVKYV